MLKKIVSFLCLWILVAFQVSSQEMRVNLPQGVSLMLPSEFRAMTDPEIAARYFHYKKPTASYLSQSSTAEFVVNLTGNVWEEKDLTMLQKFYKANISHLYTNVSFFQEEIKTINNKKFVVFEFVSEVRPDSKDFAGAQLGNKTAYTYLMYAIKGEEILVFNFTCPTQERAKWQAAADQIMKSVKVN